MVNPYLGVTVEHSKKVLWHPAIHKNLLFNSFYCESVEMVVDIKHVRYVLGSKIRSPLYTF